MNPSEMDSLLKSLKTFIMCKKVEPEVLYKAMKVGYYSSLKLFRVSDKIT